MNKHVEKVKMFKLPYFNTENSSVGHVEIEGACAGYEENRFFSTSTAGDGHHASDLVPGFHGILLF